MEEYVANVGFIFIILEVIIALHQILYYLYMCQVADELLWWRMALRDDSRQSRVPRKPSDWRSASESSAGRTGLISLEELGSIFQRERTYFSILKIV